jgi:hypothetical protein
MWTSCNTCEKPVFVGRKKRHASLTKKTMGRYCSTMCSDKAKISRPTSHVMLCCQNCGRRFPRDAKEHRRSLKKKRDTFCSIQCAAFKINSLPPNPKGLVHLKGRKLNSVFSPFRYYTKLINNRVRHGDRYSNVTIEDLQSVWAKSGGKCALTGIDIELPTLSTGFARTQISFRCASLDRKDSFKEYSLDNIQFVSRMANYAKNSYSEDDFKASIKACVEAYGTTET